MAPIHALVAHIRRFVRLDPALLKAQKALGYTFADPRLLETALTHPSMANTGPLSGPDKNYQRLEFLGDRVLDLVISEMLLNLHEDSDEGVLARQLSYLVRGETCAKVSRSLKLEHYLRFGSAGARKSGRKSSAVMADICESVIAAIYLDGGLAAAREFVSRNWQPLLKAVATIGPDGKTALQEWVQERGWELPVYKILERAGPDHAPRFRIEAQVTDHHGKLHTKAGEGSSIKPTEQMVATQLLEELTELN